MRLFEMLLFFLLALLAEIVGTLGGFGSSIFFVSATQFFFDFQTVLALTGLLHISSNTSKVLLFRKDIDWKLVLWMGVPSILLAIAGAYLNSIVDLTYARGVLGIFLILFSILFLWNPNFKVSASKTNSLLGGGLAGFLAGFIGTGGAIRGLILTSFQLEKNLFVGTSAAIDFGVDLSRTLIYLDNHYLTQKNLIYIPSLIVASFLGSYLGKRALGKLNEQTFRKIVLAIVLLMGVLLIIGAQI